MFVVVLIPLIVQVSCNFYMRTCTCQPT